MLKSKNKDILSFNKIDVINISVFMQSVSLI